ncbi:flagellar basal body rod protein FlgB [Dyella acidiphila]|uniref:Flagellar basal body rod protein FlgB n=1 Tax=Dyella acidiphila TaxID=2775866 RepID=A0ABR9G9A3_9GAMM|nr:flagellar basal body rod protein FlgB [Dyella acidiphila]MBE1160602.1 flagellar basal body rod protein FlgB [Dyella acidiphila]
MGLSLEQALGVHPAALKLRAERGEIIASNLANENTPGFKAHDIDFRARLSEAAQGSSSALRFESDEIQYRVPSGASQDGNTVDLATEQAEFAQNTVDFQTSLTFLNMKLKGLSAAINGST